MRMLRVALCLSLLMLLLISGVANAKWWIFGKPGEDVDIQYMYVNGMSFDEKDAKITVYRDALTDGLIYIRGKAKTRKSKIGAVQVTTDGKATWEKAKLSDNGAFEFSFRPQIATTYDLYVKIIDTTGKTNTVDATHKEITLSDRDMMADVKEVMDKLVEAYQNEDARAFMSHVSQDFAGDDVVLDRAIRKDFTAFDNISLRYTISSIASDPKGMVSVSILYNRFLISAKDGKSYSDKGTTQFVFKMEDKAFKVFSMKNPLIFGLSDASEVATGAVFLSGNDQILLLDGSGNVSLKPFAEGIKIITADGGDAVTEKTMTLRTVGFDDFEGFILKDEERTNETGTSSMSADFAIMVEGGQMGFMQLHSGVTVASMGAVSLKDITEAPADASKYMGFAHAISGDSYAFRLADGTYGAIEVISINGASGGGMGGTVTFRYKYQPNGQRTF